MSPWYSIITRVHKAAGEEVWYFYLFLSSHSSHLHVDFSSLIPCHLMLIGSSGEVTDHSGAGAPPQAQTAEQRLKTQKMTMRMLASFIHQDGIPGAPVGDRMTH